MQLIKMRIDDERPDLSYERAYNWNITFMEHVWPLMLNLSMNKVINHSLLVYIKVPISLNN